MTPQELKNSILQLAVQGKLVPQRPEEGSAEELLTAIRAQKQSSDSRSTVRKKKNSHKDTETRSDVPDDEIPFEIPKTWKWVRLGEIVFNREQVKPTESFSYIDIGSIDNKKQKLSIKENVIEAKNAPSRARKIVRQGDILYSTVRPYLHNMCIVDRSFSKTPIASTGFAVMACREGISNKYLFYFLLSPTFDSYANDSENSKGVAYPAINDSRLYNAPIALPPLAEQKRIVAKLEELLPLCERYGNAYHELQALNKRVPGDLRKSLLQLAVQGKLVPQRPEEGSAEELLAAIRAQKQSSCPRGSLRKKKSSHKDTETQSDIPDDEIPFEIPKTWKWVRLGEIGSWTSGSTPSRTNPNFYNGNIPWLKTGDLNDGEISHTSESISNSALEKTSVRLNPPGSVLIAMYGATIGKLGILKISATTNQACCACIPNDGIYNRFLFFYLMASRHRFVKMGEGGAQPNISKEKIIRFPFPLPPLAEQKRIVAKLEELIPLCNQLS